MILGLWYAKSNGIMLCYSWNLVAQSQIFKLNVFHMHQVSKGKENASKPAKSPKHKTQKRTVKPTKSAPKAKKDRKVSQFK